MKSKKSLMTVIAVIIAVLCMSTGICAADPIEVATWEDINTAIQNAADGSTVNVKMTGDVNAADTTAAVKGFITVPAGKTLNIDGNGFIMDRFAFAGEGTVVISNGTVTASGYASASLGGAMINAKDGVHLTVNADIVATGRSCKGVSAMTGATVIVNGNVNTHNSEYTDRAGNNMIAVDVTDEGTKVTITGNVTASQMCQTSIKNVTSSYTAYTIGNRGIYAKSGAEVTVNGNVYGGEFKGSNGIGGEGVRAEGGAKVTVNGNVTAGNGVTEDYTNFAGNATVVIDKSIYYNTADGGNGVVAMRNSIVVVSGDVVAGNGSGAFGNGGRGVWVEHGAGYVEVGGNVTGGDVVDESGIEYDESKIADFEATTKKIQNSPFSAIGAGDGVFIDEAGEVSVGGNVTGGSTNVKNGFAGNGFVFWDEAHPAEVTVESILTDADIDLYVKGDVVAGKATEEGGVNGNGIYADYLSAPITDFDEIVCAEEIFAFLFGDKDPADFTDEEKQEAVDFANSLYFALKIRVVGDVTAEDADAISGNDIAEETGLITALEEELANWKKVEKMTDVTDKDAWYYEPISFVMAYDIFLGTTETTFSPDLGMTRAMFVTVLGRICGVDDNYEAENTDYVFGDVDPDQYYAAYVAWAAENGITNGTGKNTFSPNAEIKRQDLVTMMARFSDYVGYELPEASAELFEDDADICDYAREAVYQFKDLNIIEGKGDNVFDPNGFTTRAETAKILYLFLND